jgi:DNA/RNA-binding domain of Phe-tRNA-synthetase-like protein
VTGSRFAVAPETFDRLPGLRVAVVVALGIDNTRERPDVVEAWRAAWVAAAAEAARYGNPQSHPRVAPWRERFRAMGVPPRDYPSSIEALMRRAMRGGEPFRVNPLVDAVHTVSLRHVVPAGAFDLDAIEHGLVLRPTRQGDRFTALDEDLAEEVPLGEVAYCDGEVVLTRHVVWRQSRQALVGRETRAAIVVSEALAELGEEAPGAVRDDLLAAVSEGFSPALLVDGILERKLPNLSW